MRGFARGFSPHNILPRKTLTKMHGHPSLQVGQLEVLHPVAAVGGAQQREQRLVLVDGQDLAIAESPAMRRELEGHQSDFAKIRVSHAVPQFWEGKMPRSEMMKFTQRNGIMLSWAWLPPLCASDPEFINSGDTSEWV